MSMQSWRLHRKTGICKPGSPIARQRNQRYSILKRFLEWREAVVICL